VRTPARRRGGGAYDGLALFLASGIVDGYEQRYGIIVPVDTVPAVPELPAEYSDPVEPPTE
jgi:hypothetical protein